MGNSSSVSRFFAGSLAGHDVDVLHSFLSIIIMKRSRKSVTLKQKKERGKKQRMPGDAKNRRDKQMDLKQRDNPATRGGRANA